MFSRKFMNRALLGLTALGVVAATAGGVLGFGFGDDVPAKATAAPRQIPAGTLGVGERTIAPLDTAGQVDRKIEVTGTALPSGLTTITVRAQAPLPAPKPVVRATTSASRSAAASGGWSSARVSWYGPGFYGRNTASGAVLTEGMMNCAHRSLPFGTRIQFEYNGRTAIAVVNDRGPFVGGRTFDLGPGTAVSLGFSGVGTVRYRILGR